MPSYDFTRFKEALLAASEKAFLAMRAKHPGERFYCMALYTSGEFAYVLPTAMTEEGLEATLNRYQATTRYSSREPAQLRCQLRWSPCDSPLHLEGEELFVDAQACVDEVSTTFLAIESDGDADRFRDQVYDALCEVLEVLDRRGVFGRALERHRIFVTVMMGDQDDSILDCGMRLNPPAVYERFRDEWAQAATE